MNYENLVSIPVSVGELIDKISILKVKKEKIKDAIKIEYVNKELFILESYCEQLMTKKENQENLLELVSINSKLWDVEDSIRNLELEKRFDNEFIELARKVYYLNDDRFKIKNSINEINDSQIREVKYYHEYRK